MNVTTSHSFATGEAVITLTIPAGEDVQLAASRAANVVESVLRACRTEGDGWAATNTPTRLPNSPPPTPARPSIGAPVRTAHLAAVAAAALAVAVVPLAAHADTPVAVTPSSPNGWFFDTPHPAFTYTDQGLTFAPISSTDAAEKVYAAHDQTVDVSSFGDTSMTFDVPAAVVAKAASEFYLNAYVDVPGTVGASFYDCRYDYVAATPVVGSNVLAFTRDSVPAAIVAKNGAVCGSTIATAPAGSRVFRVAINAGDTTLNDAGLTGTIDAVTISGTTFTFQSDPGAAPTTAVAPTTTAAPTTSPAATTATATATAATGTAPVVVDTIPTGAVATGWGA